MAENWHVLIEGIEKGPFSETQIRQMILKGELAEKTKVRNSDLPDWAEIEMTAIWKQTKVSKAIPPIIPTAAAIWQKGKNGKWIILGWIFVPYIMAVLYAAKHWREIFQEKSKEHTERFGIGTAWGLFMLIAVASYGGKNKTTEDNPQHATSVESSSSVKGSSSNIDPQEKTYKTGLKLYNQQKYQEAISELNPISGYKDSQYYIKTANEKHEQLIVEREQAYAKATELFNQKQFSDALPLYKQLGDFKETKKYIMQIDDVLNSEKYKKANVLIKQRKYDDAMVLLKGLGNYKDSEKLLSASSDALEANRHKERLAEREFVQISADALFNKILFGSNNEEMWDKKYSMKYVRWSAKFKEKPLLFGKLVANAGDSAIVKCKNLDRSMMPDRINQLEKWQLITIEGRLLSFGGKAVGEDRGTFELDECVVK